ncbi:MAG: Crp/Fnr family transcriptional regulator [Flavobacteriales bacterium]
MNPLEHLHKKLNGISPISSKDTKILGENSTLRSVKKGEFILKEGQIAREIGFVLSGIFRVYQLVDGKEFTSYFNYSERNQFVSSFPSFLKQNNSFENIEALEDSEVLTVNFQQLNFLYQTSKNFERLGRIMAENNYLLSMERIQSLQYQSASDRYRIFMEIYPGLLNRIPHHYIASYLGITPESMSRIRKDLLKK